MLQLQLPIMSTIFVLQLLIEGLSGNCITQLITCPFMKQVKSNDIGSTFRFSGILAWTDCQTV